MDGLPNNLAERICRQASIGIVLTDEKLAIRAMNPTAGDLFGVDPATWIGAPVERILPEYRQHLARRMMARACELRRSVELRLLYPTDAGKRHLAIALDPIVGDDDTIEGVCLWVRDQTRRMDLERRLARIDKLASLGQLAGGLAHHLNNVLGGAVTAVDHGLTVQQPGAKHRSLELVSDALANAVKLTRKLLDFSSPDLPEQNLVDLTEAVIAFVEKSQDRIQAADRRVDLEIQSTPVLAVDQFKTEQVLDALLTNAEQALGPSGGRITIRLDSDDSAIRLTFRDDGPGIDPELAERIFEPFYTTRGALGGGGEGNLGLGLTLARRLMTEMGGTLTLARPDGTGGACFVIAFALRGGDDADGE